MFICDYQQLAITIVFRKIQTSSFYCKLIILKEKLTIHMYNETYFFYSPEEVFGRDEKKRDNVVLILKAGDPVSLMALMFNSSSPLPENCPFTFWRLWSL